LAAFEQGLLELGWKDGSNLRIDYRFGEGDPTRLSQFAKGYSICGLMSSSPSALAQHRRFDSRLSRSRSYLSRFRIRLPPDLSPTWRALTKHHRFHEFRILDRRKVASARERVRAEGHSILVLFDPRLSSWPPYMRAIEASAPKLGMQLTRPAHTTLRR
jgi:hypothetical protein